MSRFYYEDVIFEKASQAMNFIEAIEAMASDYRNLAADSNFFLTFSRPLLAADVVFQYSVAYLTCSDKYQEIN